MKIEEIYKKYRIMPMLQEHQLRVTAVAMMIAENSGMEIDCKTLTTACLVHDMGNIIKANLDLYPENFTKEKDRRYWQEVKDEYIKKYGPDEHQATITIAKELGMPQEVLDILRQTGFANALATAASDTPELQIQFYSDMRVGPHGIISMKERVEEGRVRYTLNKPGYMGDEELFNKRVKSISSIEKELFKDCRIKPEDITDKSIEPFMEKARNYDLPEVIS
jgi:hypothetical protein